MASPVDSARQGTNISTAGTSHAINVGSPVNGTLLIVFVRFAAAPGAITFTGYTLVTPTDSSDASDDTTAIYYRMADGTEGATDTLTTANSVKLAAICWEITGAENPANCPIGVSTVAVGTTTLNTCNPTSAVGAAGSQDYLFMALGGQDGESAYTAAPTNYNTNLATANSGTTGNTNTNVVIAGGARQLTATSDDPGAFTHPAAATGWTAYTLAIAPTGAVPPRLLNHFKNNQVTSQAVMMGANW